MPRISRRNSINNSRIYHIILKGVNGQEIFFDDNDRIKFLQQLKDRKKEYQYEIYAYVLMNNHIHLILFDKENKMSDIMHRICTSYALYFNRKYERKGHLFQDRFKSKCVNSENYLLRLQRYIHRNPQKEAIGKMEEYKWSSYKEYVSGAQIANPSFVLSLFSENKSRAVEMFIQYNKQNEEKYGIEEFEIRKKLTDEEAIDRIKMLLNTENVLSILNLNAKTRNKYIKIIAEVDGISYKQIARILGINTRTIQRAVTGK